MNDPAAAMYATAELRFVKPDPVQVPEAAMAAPVPIWYVVVVESPSAVVMSSNSVFPPPAVDVGEPEACDVCEPPIRTSPALTVVVVDDQPATLWFCDTAP